MPRFFTVSWPFFARLEAFLLFPVSLLLAAEITRVRDYADDRLVPTLLPFGSSLGIPRPAIFWVAIAIIALVPYFVASLVVDRFLTVRKGYAFLSLVAIAIWAGAAMHLADQIAAILPDAILAKLNWRPFDQEAAIIAGGAALVLHIWPLLVGVLDQGHVADRLLDQHYRESRADRHAQDVYYQQTAGFRGWRRPDEYDGLSAEPRETSAVKVISAITWLGMLAAAAFAYHNWDNFAASKPEPPPEARAGHQVAHLNAPPNVSTPPNVSSPQVGMPLVPSGVPLSPVITAHDVHAIPTSPTLPSVQRPGEMQGSSLGPGVYTGPNEAVAARAPDGSFSFDAVVNGEHLTMMFDTGATVVALRGEDAERLGISMSRLHFSAKVKTANGIADVAPVVIDTLTIGAITQRHVTGFVAKAGMLQENLLGQTFLTRLARYNVEDNRLVLTGR